MSEDIYVPICNYSDYFLTGRRKDLKFDKITSRWNYLTSDDKKRVLDVAQVSICIIYGCWFYFYSSCALMFPTRWNHKDFFDIKVDNPQAIMYSFSICTCRCTFSIFFNYMYPTHTRHMFWYYNSYKCMMIFDNFLWI